MHSKRFFWHVWSENRSIICSTINFWISFRIVFIKGWLRVSIVKSADTAHLIASPTVNDNIRCAVSADLKMVARNRPLVIIINGEAKWSDFRFLNHLQRPILCIIDHFLPQRCQLHCSVMNKTTIVVDGFYQS